MPPLRLPRGSVNLAKYAAVTPVDAGVTGMVQGKGLVAGDHVCLPVFFERLTFKFTVGFRLEAIGWEVLEIQITRVECNLFPPFTNE